MCHTGYLVNLGFYLVTKHDASLFLSPSFYLTSTGTIGCTYFDLSKVG